MLPLSSPPPAKVGKLFQLLLCLLFLNNICYAQSWKPQSVAYGPMSRVQFVDNQTGWILGEGGIIRKTTDGGATWIEQPSGTDYTYFSDFHFLDSLTGWIVGQSGAILKTMDGGATWVKQTSGTDSQLASVHFVDSLTGWAVGNFITILHTSDGGNTWTKQKSIERTEYNFSSVYFIDDKTGWIVGEFDTILKTQDGGKTWFLQPSGTDFIHFSSVHFIDHQTGWVIGDYGTLLLKTENGGESWIEQLSGINYYSFSNLYFVDHQTGWVVGNDGIIRKTTDGGATWVEQTSGTDAQLSNVYFVNSQTGWVVGNGTILKTDDGGETWVDQIFDTKGSLISVYFVDSRTGWAVVANDWVSDKKPTILHTTNGGKAWIKQTAELPGRINSIYFVDSQTGWMVGWGWKDGWAAGSGTIQKTIDGGETWIEQPSGTEGELTSVHFVDSLHGWAVGAMGTILHTSDGGEHWIRQIADIDEWLVLSGVYFVDNSTGWAVGNYGIILHTSDGGATWIRQVSGTGLWLHSVHFIDNTTGWAVGREGTIIHTIDGGKTWVEQASRVSNGLSDVYFVDNNTGWAVGSGLILKTENGGKNWVEQLTGIGAASVHFVNSNTGWAAGRIILHYSSQEDTTGNENAQPRVNEFIVQYAQDASEEEIQDFEQILQDSGAVLLKECNECTSNPIQLWYSEDTIDLDTRLKYARDRSDVDTLEYNYEIDFQPWEESKVKLWQPLPFPLLRSLFDVHFIDSLTGWVVGDWGTISKTEDGGKTWTKQESGTELEIHGIQFVDSQTGWAVGDGFILHTNDGGATWVWQTSAFVGWLRDLHFIDTQTGWVVGYNIILKTEDGGETWTKQLSVTETDPYVYPENVYFIDSLTGWAAGGVILKTVDGGETWTKQEYETEGSWYAVNSIHFVDNLTGWVVGNVILKTVDGGETWVEQLSMTDTYLESVYFVDSLTGWAVGNVILKTVDGGKVWLQQTSGGGSSVFFIDNNTGWVVGEMGTILFTHQQDAMEQPYTPYHAVDTVRVAVVDTGVEKHHYLLQNAMGFNNIDDDGSCYSYGYGYDYVRSSSDPKDIDGHGTGVNGVIVRDFPDSIKLELMNLKFYEGEGAIFDAVCGIYHAIAAEADIINLSWGFQSGSSPGILHDALAAAREAGILIITSAGNTADDNDVVHKYPANFDLDNIITVTAYVENADGSRQLASYASYGQNNVDVAASGYLQTAANNGATSEVSGTSMAAPLVTRTAAIIMGKYPSLTYQQIRDCIFSTTDELLAPAGRSIRYGALNHQAALACAQAKAKGSGLVAIVESFTLVNAASDQEVSILEQGAIYSLDSLDLSSYSILANVKGEDIAKVVMQLEGAQEILQTEHIAPYTLFRNNGNDYFGQQPTAGEYTLTAIPYYLDQDSAEVAGQSLTINFSITDGSLSANARVIQKTTKEASSANASFHPEKVSTTSRVYPNPVHDELNLEWSEDLNEEVVIFLYNLQGIAVFHTRLQVYQKHVVMIDLTNLPAATYLVKVIAKNKVSTTLIIKGDR